MLAQDDGRRIPLLKQLESLEKQHNISFSYLDELIDDVTIIAIDSSKTLEETLVIITSQTNLTFNTIGNGYYTIIKSISPAKFTQLDNIFLTQYLAKGINQNKDGSVIIDYTNFSILPGLIEADALKTAQALPGIESVDETVSNLSIRGGTHDQNLILWDGIKMYQSGHFFGLISAFNPNLTDKTTVYKNGTPTKYTDGVSGTLALETSQHLTDSLKVGIGLNLINAEGFIDTPIGEKIALQVSARTSINQLAETPTYSSYFDKAFQDTEITNSPDNILITDDEFNFYDASLRLQYHITEKDQLQANALLVHNTLTFNENSEVEGVEESRQSGTQQGNLAGGITYKRKWNTRFNTEAQLYGTRYTLEALNADILNNQRLIQQNNVLEFGLRFHSVYNLSKTLTLENGYHFVETGIENKQDVDNPLFRRTVKDVIRRHAIYTQVNYASVNKKTFLNIGGRVNYIEKFKTVLVEPRLAFSQKIATSLTLNLQTELKHQVATQVIEFQNDFLGVENRRWILADNDSIPIVKSQQLSLGLSYKKRGWLFTAEGFLKHVDGITSQSQGFQNQFRFKKTNGSYRVYGLEALIYRQLGNFKTWLVYGFNDNRYNFETLSPSQFSNNFEIAHSATFGISQTWKKLKIASGLHYRSGKPNTLPTSNMPVIEGQVQFEDPNHSNLKDYFRWDVSATYSFNLPKGLKGDFGLSLWNILSTNNIVNEYYQASSNNSLLRIEQKALGFTPNASFRVLF